MSKTNTHTIGETELNDMKTQLSGRFVGRTMRALEGFASSYKIDVDYIPSQSSPDMEMFNLVVRPTSDIMLSELIEMAQYFIEFCTNNSENDIARLSDGRMMMMGDGDDLSAAWYEAADGSIRVWLRVWAKDNDYGAGRL